MASVTPSATGVVRISRAELLARFGSPELDLHGALCGYAREDDTRAVLTLLCHAAPGRVLEIGTALGHLTANLTRWSPADARVFPIGLVHGMAAPRLVRSSSRAIRRCNPSGNDSRVISARPIRRFSSWATR